MMASPIPNSGIPRQPDFLLRPATAADIDTLFGWVNCASSLKWKLETSELISRPGHVAWFRAKLEDGRTTIDLIEINGCPVGQIRGETKPNSLLPGRHIDIFIANEHRKCGLGAQALAQWLVRYDERPVVALISPGNMASRRLFQSAGFELQDKNDDVLAYIKKE